MFSPSFDRTPQTHCHQRESNPGPEETASKCLLARYQSDYSELLQNIFGIHILKDLHDLKLFDSGKFFLYMFFSINQDIIFQLLK